jgi:hypothetical protein
MKMLKRLPRQSEQIGTGEKANEARTNNDKKENGYKVFVDNLVKKKTHLDGTDEPILGFIECD